MVFLVATSRDDLYRQFGPMLIEALALVILDEINDLRELEGLPTRTKPQLMNALQTKLDTLSKYEWMDEDNVT